MLFCLAALNICSNLITQKPGLANSNDKYYYSFRQSCYDLDNLWRCFGDFGGNSSGSHSYRSHKVEKVAEKRQRNPTSSCKILQRLS